MKRRLYPLLTVAALVATGILLVLASRPAPSVRAAAGGAALDLSAVGPGDTAPAQPRATTARFDLGGPVALITPTITTPEIFVSGVTGTVTKVTVSLYASGFDPLSGPQLGLMRPAGDHAAAEVVALTGSSLTSTFGSGCSPESARLTFDDAAAAPFASAVPPFTGSFRPVDPLSGYNGLPPAVANGAWQLILFNFGTTNAVLHCASIFITTAAADLDVDITASPNPVAAGGDLTYTITGHNHGPDFASSVLIETATPPGTTFVFAIAPEPCLVPVAGGTGVVRCGLTFLGSGSDATVTLRVRVTAGTPLGTAIAASVTVSSGAASDLFPANNTASVTVSTPSPTPSPTPTPTPTPVPTPSPTPRPTPTPTPVSTPTPVPCPKPGACPSTPTPTATPTPPPPACPKLGACPPASTPVPPPAASPAPTPTAGPSLQPMTVSGTVTINGQPAVKQTVQAVIGGVVCGQATVGPNGTYQVSVKSTAQQAGCGTNGAAVTFRVNGAPASGSTVFQSGGTAAVNVTAASV